MDLGSHYSFPLGVIEGRIVLDEAREQGCRLGDRIVVVTRLASEHRCLQRTQVPHTTRAASDISIWNDSITSGDATSARHWLSGPGPICCEAA